MVGTTRFELATSPTPRVRSTRLSHVPTMVCTSARQPTAGYIAVLSVHDQPHLGGQVEGASHRKQFSPATFSE